MTSDHIEGVDLDTRPRTMASSLTAGIRTDIIEGRFPPGSKLRIRDLEERYGAGPNPLREALSRLTTTGLVVAEDQKGFRVAEVSAADLNDITDTRVFIECEALRRSIAAGALDWEERMVATHFRLGRVSMLAADGRSLESQWERAHEDFHTALLSMCDSKWLLNLAELMRDLTARYRHLSVAVESNASAPARDVGAEHQALFDAAMARDVALATLLLEQHLRRTTALALLGLRQR